MPDGVYLQIKRYSYEQLDTDQNIDLVQGFPTWGTCTPRGTFAYPKGYI